MSKTLSSHKSEREFFENFVPNSNLSDEEEDYLKYGFFHLTPRKNIQKGKDKKYESETSIERSGLNADIGENSKNYENIKRTYFAVGAEGVCGLVNRGIFLSSQKFAKEEKIDEDTAREKAYEHLMKVLHNAVFLKLNIRDGIEYDSNDFLNKRNSHTLPNKNISADRICLLKINESDNAMEIFKYFYEHTDLDKIRINKDEGEQNYLEDFMQYITIHEKDEHQDNLITSLRKMELGKSKNSKAKKVYVENKNSVNNSIIEEER